MANNEKLKINICFSSDNNYAKHLAAAIQSLVSNATENDFLNIYIIEDNFSEQTKAKIKLIENKQNSNIEFIHINSDEFKDCYLPKDLHFTRAAFYRLKISSLLPHLDKVIYLDADLVVNGSLHQLYETNIDNYYIAAVNDLFGSTLTENNHINSGMILFNLKNLRANNIEEQLINYIHTHKSSYLDQEAINVICGNEHLLLLDFKWNSQCLKVYKAKIVGEKSNTKENTIVLHFIGKCKPWQAKGHFEHKRYYYKYLNKTSYATFKTKYLHWLLDIITAAFCIYPEDNFYRYRIFTIKGKIYKSPKIHK